MVQISKTETGKNIRVLLKEYGMTVRDVQEELNLDSPQSVYKWLNGKALPSLENLVVLSNVLDIPMERILVMEGTEDKEVLTRRRRRLLKHPPILRAYQFTGSRRVKALSLMIYDSGTDWKQEPCGKEQEESGSREQADSCQDR